MEQKWKAVLRALTAHWRICVAAAAAGFGLRTRTLMDALICCCFVVVFFPQNLFLLPNVMDDLSLQSILAKLKINEWKPCGRVLELYPEKKKKNRQKKTICLQIERTRSQFEQD